MFSFRNKTSAKKSIAYIDDVPSPEFDISEKNIREAKQELLAELGQDGVNDKLGDRIAQSSTEWSPAPNSDDIPALIVYPTSTKDVSKIAKICHRRRIPMTGFSGGTSFEGALAATEGGIFINFQKMDKILALHERDLDVVVQPGVGWQLLNEKLADHKLFFPPDPGPGAAIGGMIGTGCSGTNAYRYGTMKDWVLSVTAVLADGTIVKTRHRPRKSSAGYDLTRLFVGASGTLGLVTEATLKITSLPENIQVAVISFPSTDDAVDVAVKVVQHGLQLAAMELLDPVTMQTVNLSGYCEKVMEEKPTLFMKFSGTKDEVKSHVSMVQRWARESNCSNFAAARKPEEVDSLWQARKTALWSFLAMKRDPSDKLLTCDVAVPISRLGTAIEATNARIAKSGFLGSTLGHVGDGNYHTAILYSEKDEVIAKDLIRETQEHGVELEGTVTGEHGIGHTFRDELEMELGRDTIALMRQLKLAMDPKCLLNCGKIFRMEPKD